MLVAILLGVCLNQAFADQNDQKVGINAGEKVAYIHTEDGLNSKVTVLDYNLGIVGTRLLSNQICVVMMMNRAVIPSLEQLIKKAQISSKPQLSYSMMSVPVKQVAQFGSHIERLCNGVPTYYAEETERAMFAACEHIINILGITICTSVNIC